MMGLSGLAMTLMMLWLSFATAAEYRTIFWNLESGESSDTTLAAQMVQKGRVDVWGLSEVRNPSALHTFEAALETANPGVDFIAKLSEEGGADRLAIVYRGDTLSAVPYSGTARVDDIGDHFFEVDSINVGGTVRPGLGIQLQAQGGEQVVVLVQHWKCCGGPTNENRRKQQAIQLNAFAIQSPSLPIISGGDYNIVLDGAGQTRAAFQELIQIWEYKEPQPNVGTHRGGSVLDGVFVTNQLSGWESSTTILQRAGNDPATTRTFSDSHTATDHRPVSLLVESDNTEQIHALREEIAFLEAELMRLKAELARLESGDGS